MPRFMQTEQSRQRSAIARYLNQSTATLQRLRAARAELMNEGFPEVRGLRGVPEVRVEVEEKSSSTQIKRAR